MKSVKLRKEMNLNKVIIVIIVLILIFSAIFYINLKLQYKAYSKTINENTNRIISKVIESYPEITENEIIEIIKTDNVAKENVLQKYGFDKEIANIETLKLQINNNIKQNVIFMLIFGTTILIVTIFYIIKKEKKIKYINNYLREVNNKNYTLKIEDNGEGELSKLRNELYKTTILLKETAENSEKEKEQLSNSLADISHQLKTPLTSIRIMLDNISENPNMEQEVREDFIREISKQIDWISSLVISLLKIAKFDAGAIKMSNKEIHIKELINNVINNLSILIEIKEIKIITNIPDDATFIADYKWQLEAITNIVKNGIEHSNQDSKIYINVEDTTLFLRIKIIDEGKGIDKKDLKHIFERFYKTKDNSEGNIGIGLSLAKAIIEKNNGYIKVSSEINKGTTFEIKYMK